MNLKLTYQDGRIKNVTTEDPNAAALLGRLNGNVKWIDFDSRGKTFINTEAIVKIEIIPEPE